jgi:hypothetical protein
MATSARTVAVKRLVFRAGSIFPTALKIFHLKRLGAAPTALAASKHLKSGMDIVSITLRRPIKRQSGPLEPWYGLYYNKKVSGTLAVTTICQD